MRALVWCITVLFAAFYPAVSSAATQAQIDQAWNKGLAWVMTNQRGDGGWSSSSGLGIATTANIMEALNKVGLTSGFTYMGGLSYLGNAEAASVDSLARQAALLQMTGRNPAALGSKLLSWRNPVKSWGAYPQYGTGLPDTPLAMTTLMDVQGSAYADMDIASALCQVLPAQSSSDNLWPYATSTLPSGQGRTAIVPSVYMVLALNKINTTRLTGVTCGTTSYSLSTVINNAVSGLLAKRNGDNGFGDTGTSAVIETALVYRALAVFRPGNAATGSDLDYVITNQAGDGTWGGEAFTTGIVLASLPAPSPLVDTDKDGIPDGVELILGSNPNLADSRFLARGAGSPLNTQSARQLAAADAPVTYSISGAKSEQPAEQPSSLTEDVVIELFVSGASSQMLAFEKTVESLFPQGEMILFHDDGGRENAVTGDTERVYLGVITDTGLSELDGKKALVHFSGRGGSYAGVAPVARATALDWMVTDNQCVMKDNSLWSCPQGHTAPVIPDAGVSEVAPALHVGVNIPVDAEPLAPDELARLEAVPVYPSGYGIAATRSLLFSGLVTLSRDEVAKLLTGGVRTSWHELNSSFPDQPVVICRLTDGGQPAANALFLDIPCDEKAPAPLPQSSSLGANGGMLTSPGYLVVENGTVGEVTGCLNRADKGGSFILGAPNRQIDVPAGGFAMGILPLERRPADGDSWDYLMPAEYYAASGQYPLFTRTWMQWRKEDVGNVAAPGGTELALLQEIRRRLADPLINNAALLPYSFDRPLTGQACQAQ